MTSFTLSGSAALLALALPVLAPSLHAEADLQRTTSVQGRTVTRQTTLTTAGGRTASVQSTATYDPATHATTYAAVGTGFYGRTASTAGTIQRTAPGSATVAGSYQTGGGRAGTYTGSTTQTAAGGSSQFAVTNAVGQTAALQSAHTNTPTGATFTATATGPQGGSAAVDGTLTRP